MITTIACPVGMTNPNIDPATAPIWVDADGNQYYVVSGVLDNAVDAKPDQITVISNMDGLQALAEMGLVPNG